MELDSSARGSQATGGVRLGQDPEPARFLGLDIGAETLKVVELIRGTAGWHCSRRIRVEHGKHPEEQLRRLLPGLGWHAAAGAAVTGRLGRLLALPRIPLKQALVRAWRARAGTVPATLVSIGSHGFAVLELSADGTGIYRENGRCSQGTGNFLRQLVERLGLDVAEASALCRGVDRPAPLSGRCPVILKTDMTHLANHGEDRARILAGLFDAVCSNVLILLKPGHSPARVALLGGVALLDRIRETFARRLEALGFELLPGIGEDALFLEATGAALLAADAPAAPPPLTELFAARGTLRLDRVPPLSACLPRVRRLAPRPAPGPVAPDTPLVAGFDIGSTGSKLALIEPAGTAPVWHAYVRTAGDPVGAAQELWRRFLAGPAARGRVERFGVTGSGREIVGSLLASCYGPEPVHVLNEIVAHAAGALFHDPRVDTIFEIGGQDAKYIRLEGGRVVECAMNEACSAGTGSFIEEQGGRFHGVEGVQDLARVAMAAREGVSLGQHCSVFMAEVIDEAVAAGVEQPAIVAGLYDSIVQNYFDRVKGCRPAGRVIFCQGMPFASDALAAAMARRTGGEILVPPDPGVVGALGIALLAGRQGAAETVARIDPARFLEARLERRESFACMATAGCGEPGNCCRIERIVALVGGRRLAFAWGGGCALYDRGTRKRKLPDRAPDPFREREALAERFLPGRGAEGRGPTLALSDAFMLKEHLPFFSVFFRGLGCRLLGPRGEPHATLQRGIREGAVPCCAPMQYFQGAVAELGESEADWLFLPLLPALPPVGAEPVAKTCPLLQAGPALCRRSLPAAARGRVLAPCLRIGPDGLRGRTFRGQCRRLAARIDGSRAAARFPRAFAAALEAQDAFEAACRQAGARALEFCAARGLPAVVVLGRPYTIHNPVLNSNAPALLREQGAIGIPLDCYPVDRSVPVFPDMYWATGQRILRAAHQVRRAPGVHAIYCSNYSCGPDSFNLHFCAHLLEGKPFAILETDGHSGDAGTRTRLEAFLHCVREERGLAPGRPARTCDALALAPLAPGEIRARGETVLIPRLGPASAAAAACLRGRGLAAELLPPADAAALALGRRHTSGKECLPMSLTLGSLLGRIEAEPDPGRRFVLFMPRPQGPCRFGAYNLLNQIVLERLGLGGRIRLWAPKEQDYFATFTPDFTFLMVAGFLALDRLQEALLEARPGCAAAETLDALHARHELALLARLEAAARRVQRLPSVLWQAVSGRLFGLRGLLAAAAADFARARSKCAGPTVLVVGEIFVRLDPFSSGYVVEELERRGVRVRLAPFHEWLDYVEHMGRIQGRSRGLAAGIGRFLHDRIRRATAAAMAPALPRRPLPGAAESIAAAGAYVPAELEGEAVLTVGSALHEWRRGAIDGVLSVGPHECLPNKIAEAQFQHASREEGLLALSLSLNGEPIDPALLDAFAYEVHARFARRNEPGAPEEARAAKAPWILPAAPRAPLPSRRGRARARDPVAGG